MRVPVLVTHGWQDYNVKQSEGLDFYQALTNVPFKLLYMWQGPHGVPSTQDYDTLLSRFFDHTLRGVDNGIETEPPVHTVGRTGTTAAAAPRIESAWPPPGTRDLALELGRSAGAGVLAPTTGGDPSTYTDTGTSGEERDLKEGLSAEDGWLYYVSAPLAAPMRIAGSPELEADIGDSADHGQLSPSLVDVAPDGSATVVSRGHLNLQYRGGLAQAVPVPAGQEVRARVRLAPQDQTIPAGHRLGLIFESSNTVWAVPDEPAGYQITVHHGSSRLVLPVVGG